jgi:hypothetical protein
MATKGRWSKQLSLSCQNFKPYPLKGTAAPFAALPTRGCSQRGAGLRILLDFSSRTP